MFDLDHWQEILHALRSNKVRTILTAFGVFWGIFMLLILLGSGNGLHNGVVGNFSGRATNSFFVWAQRTSKPYRGLPAGRSIRLNMGDWHALRERVPEAEILCPRNQLSGYGEADNVTRGEKTGAFDVMGDTPGIRHVQGTQVVQGRFINPLDLEEQRKVAVIGRRVREVLYDPAEEVLGSSIEVRGVPFQVVGVFDSSRSGDQGDRETQTIYIPFTTFQRAFNYGDHVGWFAVTSRRGVPASETEEKVLGLLKERHRIAPDDRRALGHWNMEEEYKKMQMLFGGIDTLVWIVGIGTLLAGVVGVSNIMLVIVRERTKEIGIRRAVGAPPSSIVRQILLEAVVLTTVAGYLGLVAGVFLLEGVAAALGALGGQLEMFAAPGVDLTTAVQALAVLVLAGALAGVLPARRALAIRPVEALRTE